MNLRPKAQFLTIGSAEKLQDERVLTNFMFIFTVLIPLDSVYVVGSRFSGPKFQVKRSGWSIFFAYARGLVPLVGLIAGGVLTAEASSLKDVSTGTLTTLASLAIVCLALFFVAGRVTGRAARQQRVLRAFAGVGVRPEILLDGTLGFVLDDLELAWKKASAAEEQYRTEPYRSQTAAAIDWRELYPKDVAAGTLALYYALCRYHAALSGEPVFADRARIAWERLEAAPEILAAVMARQVVRPTWLAECQLPEEMVNDGVGGLRSFWQ